jgi:hypothetical protein
VIEFWSSDCQESWNTKNAAGKLTLASEHMLANHHAPNSKYTTYLIKKGDDRKKATNMGAKAAAYEDVLARRNRPLIMLIMCKTQKIKFKKPANSRLADMPTGHPQKMLPAGVPSA